jgi:hypothetical protein
MRKTPGVKYTHTRLELRLLIDGDRRFRHVADVQDAIDRYGFSVDIHAPKGTVDSIFAGIHRSKYGFLPSAIYYDPVATISRVADALCQSCMVCGVTHDEERSREMFWLNPFHLGDYPTSYADLCFLCSVEFNRFSRRGRGSVWELMRFFNGPDRPANIDWNVEREANLLVLNKWLVRKIRKIAKAM